MLLCNKYIPILSHSWTASTISSPIYVKVTRGVQLQNPFVLTQFQHLVSFSFSCKINTLEYYYTYECIMVIFLFWDDKTRWNSFVKQFNFPFVSMDGAHGGEKKNVPWNNMFNIYFYCNNGFSYRIGPFLYPTIATHAHIHIETTIAYRMLNANEIN